jgi:hypothetical protein
MNRGHMLALELVKWTIGPVLPAGRFIRQDGPVRIPDFNEPLARSSFEFEPLLTQ